MMRNLLPLIMFLVGAGAIVGGYALIVWMPVRLAQRRIAARVTGLTLAPTENDDKPASASILKRQMIGALPILDRLAAGMRWGGRLSGLINQSGSHVGVSSVVLMCVGLGLVVGIIAAVASRVPWAVLPGALAGASVPILVLMHKRTRRRGRFEEQFPEALDLLSRAIRAGHAFTTAMGMVADEAPDPIGPEFKKTFEEQNFGIALKDALNNLGDRMPLVDVRFFVTAVLIQRETGGNLAEILDTLSHVVRERFKILRQVRVHTAHGRMTGYVLMALPAALALALSVINPEHMNVLFTEHMGRLMILGTIILQATGYVWIRQVVKIEV
jgi:tight adherence protein B